MTDREPTPRQEEAIERLVDQGVGSYHDARARVLGISEDPSRKDDHPKQNLPGKPVKYPKPGYVRDFHDGGRADEYRGGPQLTEWLSDEQKAINKAGIELVRRALEDARKTNTNL